MTAVVVLVGPPGAGKTSVGAVLARRLGVAFADSDAAIAERADKSVADIFVELGEPAFRALEVVAVADLLAEQGPPTVVALGGGSVLAAQTRALLRTAGVPVVLLEVGVSDAARRVGFNRDRPLLLGNPRQQWTALLAARQPFYDEVATLRVGTDGLSPDDVADAVVAALQASPTGEEPS